MTKDNFDKFVEELQKEIMEKELLDYNETIVKLFHNPQNWGKLPENEISVVQSYKGPCGDTMQYFLNIEDGVIKKASFITDGCGASVATASQTTMMITGKTLEYAEKLTAKDIDEKLNGLPEDHKHCAELSVRTLKKALNKYKKKVAKRK
ncbi:MAG: iron-sulfur cluster assembly scaffold protein [Promethearchaeota archaeon]|nr:MAG: iron-sulfur cluster assembly scaffold protein [Candidatus Lokiarchaeota archaeon]